jgi:hypothetical protein
MWQSAHPGRPLQVRVTGGALAVLEPALGGAALVVARGQIVRLVAVLAGQHLQAVAAAEHVAGILVAGQVLGAVGAQRRVDQRGDEQLGQTIGGAG